MSRCESHRLISPPEPMAAPLSHLSRRKSMTPDAPPHTLDPMQSEPRLIEHAPAQSSRPWAVSMRWHDLLFMHWPIKPEILRPFIPPALDLDTFESEAWIGIVPFRMTGIRPRLVPPMPWLSVFPELNVRTYVSHRGRPGVWFISLDAANPVAVNIARWWFHLPYYHAQMHCAPHDGFTQYRSVRTHRAAPPATFSARYRPTGQPYLTNPGQLDHWLTARYCLFSADRLGNGYRGDIQHEPWKLQSAEIEVIDNTMAQQMDISLPDIKPLLHYSKRVDALGWKLQKI
jgi:uncharacterized protein YqjF (DUF2071 family)